MSIHGITLPLMLRITPDKMEKLLRALDNYNYVSKYYRAAINCPWEFINTDNENEYAVEPKPEEEQNIKIWIAYLALILELCIKYKIDILQKVVFYSFLEFQYPISISGTINIFNNILKVSSIDSEGSISCYIIKYKGSPYNKHINILTNIIDDLDDM